MKFGYDSAYGPDAQEAAAARAAGIVWWGCYVGGMGAYRVWPRAEIDVVREAGIVPVPIWVPSMMLSESASQDAERALSACLALEFDPIVRPVVYSGGGFVPAGVAEWRPLHSAPAPGEEPPVGSAWQWGQRQLASAGWTVDEDTADDAFPLEGVVVLDTEEAMDVTGRVPAFAELFCATIEQSAPTPAPEPEEADMGNLVIYHDTTTLTWRLFNTVSNTMVADLTGDQAAITNFEAAGGKILAFPGAGATG